MEPPGGLAIQDWGVAVGVPGLTVEALITSFSSLRFNVTGTGFQEFRSRHLETRVANTDAIQIVSVGSMSVLSALHSAPRALTAHNVHVRHCAHVLHMSLVAKGSSMQTRIRTWLTGI